ncbi:MAG: hypothetical protein GFH25_541210n26 [Chloroflexi bacterium AL-N10]|nr:hypothetical protein [Chloroflexi bacterium AL-N1]NOK69599.1 hypothetical protein [Chloroflexi bacterium AL-N10]NOK72146.1 hypothetical protein [Chloroflexi bacterium AL-N5]
MYVGDFRDPASLQEAFAQARRLLLISTDNPGPDRVLLHRNAIDAAQKTGVDHVLYTSLSNPDATATCHVVADHAHTEAYLQESDIPYTILRNNIYAEPVPMLIANAFHNQPIELPEDAPVAYVTRHDLADATAHLLMHGGYINEILDLTRLEALTIT